MNTDQVIREALATARRRGAPIARRHPAEVTSDRLAEALEHWPDEFDGGDRDMVAQIRHVLETIAEKAGR